MYITKFIAPTKAGTSAALISYLEKEEQIARSLNPNSMGDFSMYLDKQNRLKVAGKEYFFNGHGREFERNEVTAAIDHNVRGLKKKEARFYTFAIAPSSEEMAHLQERCRETLKDLSEAGISIADTAGYKDALMREFLKQYAEQCMDAYAQNFGREGINSNRDLLWYGMVENDRYWKANDAKVIANKKIDKQIEEINKKLKTHPDPILEQQKIELEKQYHYENFYRKDGSEAKIREMMPKSGENWHVHVVVSRRDVTNSMSLSPNSNDRGTKAHKLNGKNVAAGFNRDQFKMNCEKLFDHKFNHVRLFSESYEGAKLKRDDFGTYLKCALADRRVRREQRLAKTDSSYIDQLRNYESIIGRQLWIRERNEEILRERAADQMQQGAQLPQSINDASLNLADQFLNKAGLQNMGLNISPIRGLKKTYMKGVHLKVSIDRRRESMDEWTKRLTEKWHKENYTFDSIATRKRIEIFSTKVDHLEHSFGESPIMYNANQIMLEYEQKTKAWFNSFIDKHLPTANMAIPQTQEQFAEFLFQAWPPEVAMQHLQDFEEHFQEQKSMVMGIQEILKNTCAQEQQWCAEYLQTQFGQTEQVQSIEAFRAFLDKVSPPELQDLHMEALLRQMQNMAQQRNKLLIDFLREKFPKKVHKLEDLTPFLIDKIQVAGKVSPEVLQKQLGEFNKQFGEITEKVSTQLKEAIDSFIATELTGYKVLISTQTDLEDFLHNACTPEELQEYLDTAREQISAMVNKEYLFIENSRKIFGKEVVIKNEQQFRDYLRQHFPKEIHQYEARLQNIFVDIEQQRQRATQAYVDNNLQHLSVRVMREQRYLNRFINQTKSASVAHKAKEKLQQAVASRCKSYLHNKVEYKALDGLVRQNILRMAATKASKVMLPISPQQIAIKAIFKIGKLMIKGL